MTSPRSRGPSLMALGRVPSPLAPKLHSFHVGPCPWFPLVSRVDKRLGGRAVREPACMPVAAHLVPHPRQEAGGSGGRTQHRPVETQLATAAGSRSLDAVHQPGGIACAQAPPYGNEGQTAGTPTCRSTQKGGAGRASVPGLGAQLLPRPPHPRPCFQSTAAGPPNAHMPLRPPGGQVLGSMHSGMLVGTERKLTGPQEKGCY